MGSTPDEASSQPSKIFTDIIVINVKLPKGNFEMIKKSGTVPHRRISFRRDIRASSYSPASFSVHIRIIEIRKKYCHWRRSRGKPSCPHKL